MNRWRIFTTLNFSFSFNWWNGF